MTIQSGTLVGKVVTLKLVLCISLLILSSGCGCFSNGKRATAESVKHIREGMSESAIVELLGKPQCVRKMQYDPDNQAKGRTLFYTLDDGRKWIVVINEKDETVGSGQRASTLADISKAF